VSPISSFFPSPKEYDGKATNYELQLLVSKTLIFRSRKINSN
jgi:hypothetical protein